MFVGPVTGAGSLEAIPPATLDQIDLIQKVAERILRGSGDADDHYHTTGERKSYLKVLNRIINSPKGIHCLISSDRLFTIAIIRIGGFMFVGVSKRANFMGRWNNGKKDACYDEWDPWVGAEIAVSRALRHDYPFAISSNSNLPVLMR